MSHTYEGSDTDPMFGRTRWHTTGRDPRSTGTRGTDPKYRDDARECPVCGCYRRKDCREACG